MTMLFSVTLICDKCGAPTLTSSTLDGRVDLPPGWAHMRRRAAFDGYVHEHYCPKEECRGVVSHQLAYGGRSSVDVWYGKEKKDEADPKTSGSE
jgi:hypothetical protein